MTQNEINLINAMNKTDCEQVEICYYCGNEIFGEDLNLATELGDEYTCESCNNDLE